ncbi:hypothetical protein SK128_000303, partial [Halocaridina rubra]
MELDNHSQEGWTVVGKQRQRTASGSSKEGSATPAPPLAKHPPLQMRTDAAPPSSKTTYWLNNWFSAYTPPGDIDQTEEELVNALQATADSSIQFCKQGQTNHHDRWYYCNRIKELNHWLNVIRRLHRNCPAGDSYCTLQAVKDH